MNKASTKTIILFVGLIALHLFTPKTSYTQESTFIKHYSVLDGLSERIVTKIIRDSKGRFWIFNNKGVQFYNGRDFQPIKEFKTIPFDSINEINYLNNGNISLLGSNHEFTINTNNFNVTKEALSQNEKSYFQNGEYLVVDTTDHSILTEDNKFELEKDAIKVFFNNGYLYYLDNLNTLRITDSFRSTSIEDVKDLIGIANQKVLFLKSGKVYSVEGIQEIEDTGLQGRYAHLRHDTLGQALLGLSDDQRRIKHMHLFTGNEMIDYSHTTNVVNTIIDYYGENFKNEILLATYEGLIYQSFGSKVEKIFYDKNLKEGKLGKVLWWTFYRPKEKAIYFAKETSGVYKYKNGQVNKVFPNDEYPNSFPANFFGHYDHDLDLLIAASRNSDNDLWLWKFADELKNLKLGSRANSFCKQDDTTYLVGGSRNGIPIIHFIDLLTFNVIKEIEIPQIGNLVRKIVSNNDHYMVITNKGMYELRTNHKSPESVYFEIEEIFNSEIIDHVSEGQHDVFCVYNSGLTILKNNEVIKTIKVKDGLLDNTAVTIRYIKEHFWVCTLKGISILDKQFNVIKNIRKEDGLTSIDLNQGSFSFDGKYVYIGTINGLSKIDTDIVYDRNNMTLVPEEITYYQEGKTLSQKIHNNTFNLPYGVDSCEINYSNYAMYRSISNEDQFFLNKLQIGDKTITPDKAKISVNLRTTKSNLLISSPFLKSEKILIQKDNFVKAFGLYIIIGFLMALLVYAIYRLIDARLQKQKEKIKNLNNRLDAMRHSALRAQMNPHFIFNALGSIQYHIQKQDTHLAEEYLSDFAQLMRAILDSAKDDFVMLKDEIKMLQMYLKLELLRFDEKFNYTLNIDDSVDMTSEIPSMIIQPFLENAINHGLYHLKSRKGILAIEFKDEKEELICEIKDNGIGRLASKELSKTKHKSRGMNIVQERIELLSSNSDQQYDVKIVDLYEKNKALGTHVTLTFG